uniref:Uncharacterized protein n=1 Tax=Arundo donax TaxID=35708 RepID=A0A0A8Z904_ARUDO
MHLREAEAATADSLPGVGGRADVDPEQRHGHGYEPGTTTTRRPRSVPGRRGDGACGARQRRRRPCRPRTPRPRRRAPRSCPSPLRPPSTPPPWPPPGSRPPHRAPSAPPNTSPRSLPPSPAVEVEPEWRISIRRNPPCRPAYRASCARRPPRSRQAPSVAELPSVRRAPSCPDLSSPSPRRPSSHAAGVPARGTASATAARQPKA